MVGEMTLSMVLFFAYLLVLMQLFGVSQGFGMREYCEDDTFEASCAEDEIIVFTFAEYGRMHAGHCISQIAVESSCTQNVINIMDQFCSGRQTCTVAVSQLVSSSGNTYCQKDYRSFLEADYTCVKVLSARRDSCRSSSFTEVTATSGNLASRITEQSGCGGIDSPWLINLPQGYRINFTLWDFAVENIDGGHSEGIVSPCHVYAIIKENEISTSRTICSNNKRISPVYVSTGNSVEVRFVTKRQPDESRHFMLSFEAMGCPNLTPPAGATFKRKGDQASVECLMTAEVWKLSCVNEKWVGKMGNCSKIPSQSSPNASPSWNSVTGSQGLSIAIIIGVAILVGLSILTLGLFCLKWRRAKHPAGMQPLPPTAYSRQGSQGNFQPAKVEMSPGSYAVANENNYYRTWQLQQHQRAYPPPRSAKDYALPSLPRRKGSLNDMLDEVAYSHRRPHEPIYHSPRFEHEHPFLPTLSSSTEDIQDAQDQSPDGAHYFELDPEAVQFQSTFSPNTRPDEFNVPNVQWNKSA